MIVSQRKTFKCLQKMTECQESSHCITSDKSLLLCTS